MLVYMSDMNVCAIVARFPSQCRTIVWCRYPGNDVDLIELRLRYDTQYKGRYPDLDEARPRVGDRSARVLAPHRHL